MQSHLYYHEIMAKISQNFVDSVMNKIYHLEFLALAVLEIVFPSNCEWAVSGRLWADSCAPLTTWHLLIKFAKRCTYTMETEPYKPTITGTVLPS